MFGVVPDKRRPALERAAFAIAAYCALAGGSTASVAEWVAHDVSIAGTEGISAVQWDHAAEVLGEVQIREKAEQLVLARADLQTVYLAWDPAAADDEFALAVTGDHWPILLGGLPASTDDPEQLPPGLTQLLLGEPSSEVVLVHPRTDGVRVPDGLQEAELVRHGRVSYQRLSDDPPEGGRLIFVQFQDPAQPWRQTAQVIHVSADGPPDHEVISGYLDCLQVRREFAGLLAQPPTSPFTLHDRAASVWPFVCWIALLLTRQIEKDVSQSWPEVRTELQRVQDVLLPQPAGRVRTPLSFKQQDILRHYPGV